MTAIAHIFGVQSPGRGDITATMMRLFAALLILTSVIGLGLTPVGLYVGGAYAGSEGPAEFFSGIEDFPLMPGLTELPDATLVFDSPSGRFVEAYATGLASPAEMARFYSSSLPQLGWRATGGASYQREGEVLEIEIVGPAADDGTRTVRFAISPAGNDVTGD